jgi:signal transduction histidine kinase/ActR/RegA family two-component response regulator
VVRERDIRLHAKFIGFPEHHPEIRSLLAVPIFYRGRAVGNIYLGNKRDADGFTDEDERRVRMLAIRTGAAIETARLYEGEALQKVWLQNIFDQMPEGVVIVDAQGKIQQQNVVAQAFACRRDSSDVGGDLSSFDLRTEAGEIPSEKENPLLRALRDGKTTTAAEFTLSCHDGALVPALVSATPVKTEKGTMGAVVIFQDIRALKELERLREEWASIVAHDLRQPVTTISLRVELIRRLRAGQWSDEERSALDGIAEDSRRLDRMVNDLLDLSRIEAHRLPIERKILNVNQLTKRAIDSLTGILEGHSIRYLSLEEELFANVDPDRFQQIIGNLLSNAVKYSDAGSEILVVVIRKGDEIDFSVSNRGPGLTADEIAMLFTRFARARAVKAGRARGIGLGLYITKGLVEAHGGRIWAESVPGKTTTFHFRIPLAKKPALSLDTSLQGASLLGAIPDVGERPLDGKSILVVDDSADMRMLLRLFLEKAGAKVAEAGSVNEAFRKAMENRPDALITDIEMPGESGYDLLERIRRLPEQKKMPVAALSAYTDEKETKRIMEAGFAVQLAKPLSPERLISAVQEIVARYPRDVSASP